MGLNKNSMAASTAASATGAPQDLLGMPSKLANYEAESARLHGEIQRLQRSMSTLQQTNQQQARELAAVQEQLKQSESQQHHADRKALIATVDCSINPDRTALLQMQSELELQRRQVTQLENELMSCKASHESRLEELQQEFVGKVRQMRATQAQQLEEAQHAQHDAEARLASVVDQAAVLEQQVESYRQQCKLQEQQLHTLMKKKHEVGNKLQQAQARVTQLETEVVQLKASRQKLVQQLSQSDQTTGPSSSQFQSAASSAAQLPNNQSRATGHAPALDGAYVPSFLRRVVASQQQSTSKAAQQTEVLQQRDGAELSTTTGHLTSGDVTQQPDQFEGHVERNHASKIAADLNLHGVEQSESCADAVAEIEDTTDQTSVHKTEVGCSNRASDDADSSHECSGAGVGSVSVSGRTLDAGSEVDVSIIDMMEAQLRKLSGVIRAQEESMSELRVGLQQQELQQQKLLQENHALQQSVQEWERWKTLVLNQGRKAAAVTHSTSTASGAGTGVVAGSLHSSMGATRANLRAGHPGLDHEPSSSSIHSAHQSGSPLCTRNAAQNGTVGASAPSTGAVPRGAGDGHTSGFPARHHHVHNVVYPPGGGITVSRKAATHNRQYGRRAGQQPAAKRGMPHRSEAGRRVPFTAPALDQCDMHPPGTSGSGCSARSSSSLPATMQGWGAVPVKMCAASPAGLGPLDELRAGFMSQAVSTSTSPPGHAWSQIRSDLESASCGDGSGWQRQKASRQDGCRDVLNLTALRHNSIGKVGAGALSSQLQSELLSGTLPELTKGVEQKRSSSGSNVKCGYVAHDNTTQQLGMHRQLSLRVQPGLGPQGGPLVQGYSQRW